MLVNSQGAAFKLYFPASEKKLLERKQIDPGVLMGSETILIVDNEESVLEVSKKILGSLGYTVYGMKSGQEAISFFKK